MDRRITKQLMDKARTQYGLLRQEDVTAVDPSRTVDELVRSNVWAEVLPGIVAPAAAVPTRELLESASALWIPDSQLSHHSAARRNEIWVPDDPNAWITVPFQDPHRSRDGLRVSRSRQMPTTGETDGFHTWTTADRTLVDLAQQLTRRQLEAVLLSAVRKAATSIEAVLEQARLLRKRPTVQLLLEVAALWSAERESFLEDLLYSDVCSVVGADRVERQYVITKRSGGVQARIDVAVPDLRLAFEADGLLFHSTDVQVAADQARDRGLFKRGWHTTRYREGVLDDRALVRADISEIVDRRRRDRAAA